MVKMNKVVFILLWIIITVVEYNFLRVAGVTGLDYYSVSCIVVGNLALQTLTLVVCRIPLASFFYAFIVFYYLFHFGQVFMNGFFPDYKLDYVNYVNTYMTDSNMLVATMLLCIVSINAFFLGGLLVRSNKRVSIKKDVIGVDAIRKLFFILIPFRILIDGVQIVAAMLLGYYGAIDATDMIPGIISSLGNMWYALVPMFYLTLQGEKARKQFVFLILVYMGISMLTGNRGHQIVCLVSLFLVIFVSNDQVSVWRLIKYIIAIIIGLFFIDIIYEMRETSISEFVANPLAFAEYSRTSNIILETIGTFGETIYTPYLTIEGFGRDYHSWFGETFVKSLVGVIPDVFGWFRDVNNEAIFQKNLNTESPIGGSFCGEMFYSFKGLYPLVSAIIGYMYCKLSNDAYYSIKNRNYQNAFMAIVICSLSLWWVRDSIGNLTRQIVWMYWLYLLFRAKARN